MSMRELLEDSAASPSRPLDVVEVWKAGRRRRTRFRIATATAVAAGVVAVVAVGTTVVLRSRIVGIEPVGTGAGGEDVDQDAGEESLDTAVERLIAANRRAERQPALVKGRQRTTRTLAVWSATTVGNGTSQTRLQLVDRLFTQNARGKTELVTEAVRRDIALGTDADELRRLAGQVDLSAVPDGAPKRWQSDSIIYADGVLEEAAHLARAEEPAEPAPQTTERPSDMQAFIRVADALRETVPSPPQRIRALEIIASLDRSLVEYGGNVRDLLGREGIGIAATDRQNQIRHTLIFDPETGDLLGEEQTALAAIEPDVQPPTVIALTAVVSADIVKETG